MRPVCPGCRNQGFVMESEDPFTVRPCSRCKGECGQYEKWMSGGYDPTWESPTRTSSEPYTGKDQARARWAELRALLDGKVPQ